MVLFKLRAGLIFGPNLIACGMYPLRGWHTLLFWIRGRRRVVSVRLPVRVMVRGDLC